jgi:hypothetical membrane protein
MKPSRTIKTFTDRFPLVGPIIWILCIQYFVIQIVAAAAWTTHYSLSQNAISDLGNTACGLYGMRYVCSPLHSVMNASFIGLGCTMAVGALLIYQEFKEKVGTLVGFSFMAIAGLGAILVGLFPENTIGLVHSSGAALVFVLGNLGMIILSLSLVIPRWLRVYTFLSGVISLVALGLYLWQDYLGIGLGGMERLVAYPQTVWLIVFGIYISRSHRKGPR